MFFFVANLLRGPAGTLDGRNSSTNILLQGIQEKKSSNKFNCRVCNEKQSVKRVFASHDSAKEIRLITQKLNMEQGERRSAFDPPTNAGPINHLYAICFSVRSLTWALCVFTLTEIALKKILFHPTKRMMSGAIRKGEKESLNACIFHTWY
jgi:hypothetical protein